jgi:hypothetical protein
MTFKRVDGFVGCMSQRFIDRNVPTCPICGSCAPCWTIDEVVTGVAKYLFKCEVCNCILSSSISDVSSYSRAALAAAGSSKFYLRKIRRAVKMRIEHAGNLKPTNISDDLEITLEELIELAHSTRIITDIE